MRALALLVLLSIPALRATDPPEDPSVQLLTIKRLFVDKFSGGESAQQVRDIIIASLLKTKLFVITENPDRADAILRGSAEDLIFTDTFQTSEGITARVGSSAGERRSSKDSDYGSAQAAIGENESTRIAERKHEASASVRIVGKDGDVIWATMQESQGGKFRSASADVAERIARQLVTDVKKLKGLPASPAEPPAPLLTPK